MRGFLVRRKNDSESLQVEKLDIEMRATECIRRWICVMKKIKKRVKRMKETTFEVILN